MEPLGMYLSLPWGLFFYTIIITAVFMIIGGIWWVVMEHLPEDKSNWSDENRFVFKADDE